MFELLRSISKTLSVPIKREKKSENDESEKRRETQKERRSAGLERRVYILSYLIRGLKLLWMRWMPLRVSCARLPRRIHLLFHFKHSAALFWVAVLSPQLYRYIHHFFYPFSSPSCLVYGPYNLWFMYDLNFSRVWKFCEHQEAIYLSVFISDEFL